MKKPFYIFLMALVSGAALVSCGGNSPQAGEDEIAQLGRRPKVGVWYRVTPEVAVTCRGTEWNGFFRKGSENKVMVYLCGGGVSVNEYTAARGSSVSKENYYFDSLGEGMGKDIIVALDKYICCPGEVNPFKDWSVLVVPYVSADFHCGTGERPYTSLEGKQELLYHHGYTNLKAFLDMARPLLGSPEALLVTGSSAGGFGTAIMADDVISYFPDTPNVTAVVDAAVLASDDWLRIARDEWKAPDHILARLTGDNIVLDCLKALHRDRPDVKIPFGISRRDGILADYQNYMSSGTRPPMTVEDGVAFQNIIKSTVSELRATNPGVGINIWDDGKANSIGLTTHTIEGRPEVFTDFTGKGNFATWMMNAVNGQVDSFGLDLLDGE